MLGRDENEARLAFCLDLLDKTSDFAIAVKPNEQYLFGFTYEDHKTLVNEAHRNGLLCILDCKLGDIADTSESKLYWVRRTGYDAITVHTQQGNLQQIVREAHLNTPKIGIFALVLMSNQEAVKYFKTSKIDDEPVYVSVARDVKAFEADGCVVGATGHVTEQEIQTIVKNAGKDKAFLVPGLGTQRGDPQKVFRAGVENVLFNVGRNIIYSEDPASKAREYSAMLNALSADHNWEAMNNEHK
jgi:orotidine-5'-phosphate decarboxylase